MKHDRIAGQWKQLAPQIKEKWGKLTDDDMQRTKGNGEYLAGRIEERYGISRDMADTLVRQFQNYL